VRGGMLMVPVKVTNAFGVKAFGLEVNYCADKMTFVGVNQTDLTDDFVAVDGNDIERGMVRIGGYSRSGIQDRSDGILVELVFQVREPGGEVEIVKAFDDLKEFIITR
ncbi:MAG: cohesin domain-containing protein, partial [Candidatus Aminicenantes bacterium]|nr:cohesin domain-containing protein [Candidatus Aminicenantes bacterium]